MILNKQLVTAALNNLPDKFTLDEVMQSRRSAGYVLHKIERAREKSKQGKTFSTREAKKRLAKWLK